MCCLEENVALGSVARDELKEQFGVEYAPGWTYELISFKVALKALKGINDLSVKRGWFGSIKEVFFSGEEVIPVIERGEDLRIFQISKFESGIVSVEYYAGQISSSGKKLAKNLGYTTQTLSKKYKKEFRESYGYDYPNNPYDYASWMEAVPED